MNEDVWYRNNLNEESFEVRAYAPEDGSCYYLLEDFETKKEALKFIEYLMENS